MDIEQAALEATHEGLSQNAHEACEQHQIGLVALDFFGQGGSITAVIVWGCLMSFFNLGAWGVLYTYTPELYPVRFRA